MQLVQKSFGDTFMNGLKVILINLKFSLSFAGRWRMKIPPKWRKAADKKQMRSDLKMRNFSQRRNTKVWSLTISAQLRTNGNSIYIKLLQIANQIESPSFILVQTTPSCLLAGNTNHDYQIIHALKMCDFQRWISSPILEIFFVC